MLQLPKSIILKHLPRPCPNAIREAALQTSTTRVIAMIELAGNTGLRRSEIATAGSDDPIPGLLGHSLLMHAKGRRERALHPEGPLAQHYDPLAMDPALTDAHTELDRPVDKAFGANKRLRSIEERATLLFDNFAAMTSQD